MKWLRITVAVVAGVAAAFPSGAAVASTSGARESAARKCDRAVDESLTIVWARNMRCRAAARVMGRYDGSIERSFDAGAGFRCHLVRGRPVSGIWRCRKDDKAFRFAFGD